MRSTADSPPLSGFPVIDTRDPEELRRALFAFYGSARAFDVLDRDQPFAARGHDCALPSSGLSYSHYAAPVRFRFDATGDVRRKFCLDGRGEVRLSKTALTSSPQSSCTIPADAESELDFGEGYRQIIVRFRVDALARKLSSWVGASPSRPLTFKPVTDKGAKEDQRLWRTIIFLMHELDLAGSDTGPGLVEIEQLLMLNFLLAAEHNCRHLLERGPPDSAPWQVRRAEEFIAANLDQALTIESIAAATGASVRSIFKSFHASRGYSPMAFAKMRRLERARGLLQAPDATTTVTGVALQCGFLNQGHFARDYRERFGELPSRTLKSSR